MPQIESCFIYRKMTRMSIAIDEDSQESETTKNDDGWQQQVSQSLHSSAIWK